MILGDKEEMLSNYLIYHERSFIIKMVIKFFIDFFIFPQGVLYCSF